MSSQFWWFLARGSGIVAWLFLTASVLWGVVLATDLFSTTRRRAWLLDLHRWLGGLTVSFLAVHVGALLADSYIEFSFTDVVVPFATDYKSGAVAYGVLAMWGVVAVEVTSLAMKHIPKVVWRGVHRSSAVTFWLASLHGTYAGTDAGRELYVMTSLISIVVVMVAVAYRLYNRQSARVRTAPAVGEVVAGNDN